MPLMTQTVEICHIQTRIYLFANTLYIFGRKLKPRLAFLLAAAFQCTPNSNNFEADPENCRNFFRCVFGQTFKFSCPYPLNFDPASSRCTRKKCELLGINTCFSFLPYKVLNLNGFKNDIIFELQKTFQVRRIIPLQQTQNSRQLHHLLIR